MVSWNLLFSLSKDFSIPWFLISFFLLISDNKNDVNFFSVFNTMCQWASIKSSSIEGTSDLKCKPCLDITEAARQRRVWYCRGLILQSGISFSISDGFWPLALHMSMWAPCESNNSTIYKDTKISMDKNTIKEYFS